MVRAVDGVRVAWKRFAAQLPMEPARPARTAVALRPSLTVYTGDETSDGAASRRNSRGGDELSPRSTVTEFTERWFIPIILVGEKNSDPKTIYNYRTAVAWWEALTDQPSLDEIDGYTLADFQSGLRGATWRKGPNSPLYPLKVGTQHKHAKNLRTILDRVGPTFDRKRLCADVVDSIPYLRVSSPKRSTPLPTFTLDEARRVVAAAMRIKDRDERWVWVARFSLMFYGGLRIGSALAASRSMIREQEGRPWLTLPGDDVKTGNDLAFPMHSELLAAVQRLSLSSERLCPWSMHPRTLVDHHERLQREAGIAEPYGFNAWRRLYAKQMILLGAPEAQRAAQIGCDHASAVTTKASYANAETLLVDRLPPLVVNWDGEAQQRLF